MRVFYSNFLKCHSNVVTVPGIERKIASGSYDTSFMCHYVNEMMILRQTFHSLYDCVYLTFFGIQFSKSGLSKL